MNNIKSKFKKMLLAFCIMFAFSFATLASNNSLDKHENNSVTVLDEENSYSTVEDYQSVTKQEKKSNSVATLSNDEHGEHTEEDGWEVLTADTSFSTGKKYYLLSHVAKNISISSNIEVSICLNGKILYRPAGSSNRVITMTGGTLNIYDCKEGDTSVNNTAYDLSYHNSGIISYGQAQYGAGVYLSGSSTTFNFYGGAICGNVASGNGGGVYATNSATFNMYGGSVSNNTSERYGGGVYVNGSAIFNLYDGNVINNKTNSNGLFAGGVYIGSTMNMEGGMVAYNTMNGTYEQGILLTVLSSFTMSGGYFNQGIEKAPNADMYVYGGYVGENAKAYLYASPSLLSDGTTSNTYMILGITEEYEGYEEDFPYAIVLESSHTTHDYTYSYEQIGDETYHRAYCYCLDAYIEDDPHTFGGYSPDGEDTHFVICDYCEYQGTTYDCSFTYKTEQLDDNSHTAYCACGNFITVDCTYTYNYRQFISSSNLTHHAAYCECGNYLVDEHNNITDWIATTVEGYDEERTCNDCGYTEYRIKPLDDTTDTDTSDSNTDDTDDVDNNDDTGDSGDVVNEEPDNEGSGLSAGAIAGIVIGCILGVGLIAFGVYFFFFREKSKITFNKK